MNGHRPRQGREIDAVVLLDLIGPAEWERFVVPGIAPRAGTLSREWLAWHDAARHANAVHDAHRAAFDSEESAREWGTATACARRDLESATMALAATVGWLVWDRDRAVFKGA